MCNFRDCQNEICKKGLRHSPPFSLNHNVSMTIHTHKALSDVKPTSVAGKELASMDDTDKDKVTANLTTNLQKKVNKVFELNVFEYEMMYASYFWLHLFCRP